MQYTPRGFPTFRKTPMKIFLAENLQVFQSPFFSAFSHFFSTADILPTIKRLTPRIAEFFLRGTRGKQCDGYRWFQY